MLKRLSLALLFVLLLLAAAVAANTLRQHSRQIDVPRAPTVAIDEKALAESLAGAVRFRTIAERDRPSVDSSFNALACNGFKRFNFHQVDIALLRTGDDRLR